MIYSTPKATTFSKAFLIAATLILSLGFVARASAAQSLPIYTDSLQNGWQDWSYSTHDIANTSPVQSGSKSISVTYAPWKAVYFHHAAMSVAPYASITFWMNGGKTGGQRFQIAALDSKGKPEPSSPSTKYLPGGMVPAHKWTKITVPLANLKIADKAHFTGFWIQDMTGKAQPTYYIDSVSLVGK